MDLGGYLRLLRRRWLLVAVCVLASGGAAAAVTSTATPLYRAQVRLLVSATGSHASDLPTPNAQAVFVQQRLGSYVNIVTAPTVTQAVVEDLALDTHPSILAAKVEAEVQLGTALMTVSVRDTSPGRAEDIANAVGLRFAALVDRLETPPGRKRPAVEVSLIQPAYLTTAALVNPRPAANLAVGLVAGLVFGMGLAVLRETLDTSVRSVDHLRDVTGRPSLGLLAFDSHARRHPLVVHTYRQTPRAEGFRALRTNVLRAGAGTTLRSLVVTSAVAREGRSAVACNLAVCLAQAGTRVVLLEADMRRPTLAASIGVDDAAGLTSVLSGRKGAEFVLQTWGRDGLAVIPAGPVPANPSELLGSKRMVELLADLEHRFDLVVLDAPPLLPVTDTAVLSQACDATVLVVRYGKTRRQQVSRAVEALAAVDVRLLGTVLTMAPTKGPCSHDDGGYLSHTSPPDLPVAAAPAPDPGIRTGNGFYRPHG